MNKIKLKESEIKPIEGSIKIEENNILDLKTMDTNIIVNKLETNLKTRLTTKDMFEILK